jgi:RNA recognition motif-containing protein
MNIYVANFDLQWKNEDLQHLFATYGVVQSAEVVMDAFTDKSRGFGYVEMPSDEEGSAAIAALNQKEVNGRLMNVQPAEPRQTRRGSYKVGQGGVNPYRFRKN